MLDRLRRGNDFLNRHWVIGFPVMVSACFGLGVAVGNSAGASLKTALFIGAGMGLAMLLTPRNERPRR